MTQQVKLLIMGHSQHGKDTVCQLLETIFGIRSISSSRFAADEIVYPVLKERYGYTSVEECYNDRHNHQQEWFELIKDFNTPDGCRLARRLFQQYDVYNGIRNVEEFQAIKAEGLFDVSIWVDASKRKPPEAFTSCTVTSADVDIILLNNEPLYKTAQHLIPVITSIYPFLK